MARNFSQRPSEMYGIADPGIALDFDRLCNLRLMFSDAEMERKKADAIRSGNPSGNGFNEG